ncbi:MAG TPA: flagellar basal body-associated FliL family protein [Burkholderiaceae bacterium]|nr:flagellar basal body-associated FliL family protein [Burkholderiaceae bacterium]
MSDAADKDKDAAPKKGKKGLIVALAAVLLLGGGGGGAAWYFLKGEPDEEAAAARAAEKRKAAHVFVTLEPFVVNLADRETERYAQVGVVLEVEDKDVEAKLAAKMPAVRNEILLLISSKQAGALTSREGKEALAGEIALAAARPLGWTPAVAADDGDDEEEPPKKSKSRKDGKEAAAKPKKAPPKPLPNPVAQVHFASFLVQ